jgi:hypothetical protein
MQRDLKRWQAYETRAEMSWVGVEKGVEVGRKRLEKSVRAGTKRSEKGVGVDEDEGGDMQDGMRGSGSDVWGRLLFL